MTDRRWLVTGCSSGLGRALAEHLARAGEKVLATARNPETLQDLAGYGDHVATAALDVREAAQCEAAITVASQRFGGIDVLVNNAAYGQFGVTEELSDTEVLAQFDTNVFGPWRLTRLLLPQWRAQGSGHVMFVSSISGSVPLPGLCAYTASKFALEGLAESLAQEVAHFGVRVTILQLGGFATAYGDKAIDPARRIEAYGPVVGDMLSLLRNLRSNPDLSPPSYFAEIVHHLARTSDTPLRVPFGALARDYLDAALTARRESFDATATLPLPLPLPVDHEVTVMLAQQHGVS